LGGRESGIRNQGVGATCGRVELLRAAALQLWRWLEDEKILLFIIAFCFAPVCAAAPPPTVYSINTITIGKASFNNIREVFGEANEVSTCWHSDADCKGICYVYSKNSQSAYLIFETSSFESETIYRDLIGSELAIYNYRLSLINPQIECSPTQIDLFSLETGNGFKLGQNSAEFKKKGAVKFKRKGKILTYSFGKKKAHDWFQEGRYDGCEWTGLEAQFKSDKLMEILVTKIEEEGG
jgi:hypothetical protein